MTISYVVTTVHTCKQIRSLVSCEFSSFMMVERSAVSTVSMVFVVFEIIEECS